MTHNTNICSSLPYDVLTNVIMEQHNTILDLIGVNKSITMYVKNMSHKKTNIKTRDLTNIQEK